MKAGLSEPMVTNHKESTAELSPDGNNIIVKCCHDIKVFQLENQKLRLCWHSFSNK